VSLDLGHACSRVLGAGFDRREMQIYDEGMGKHAWNGWRLWVLIGLKIEDV